MIYKLFAIKYKWTAEEVNELSFPQIDMYVDDAKEKRISFPSIKAAQEWQKAKRLKEAENV